jgi:multidrug efflux system membrane fusion protein
MTHRSPSAPGFAFGLAGVLLLGACAEEKQAPAPPPTPVTVAAAERRPVPLEVQATGTVEPLQTVTVQPQLNGPVTRVAFSEGQDVREGQVLFEIDPRPYRAALAQAEAHYARDRATAQNAEQEAKRYQALASKEYVTAQQYDQARTAAAAATATLAASRAAVEEARLNLQYATVRAPIAGRTGALMVRQGNLVRANSGQTMVTINQIRPILVRFAVPSRYLPQIQRYQARGPVAVHVVPTGSGQQVVPAGPDQGGNPAPGALGDTASRQASLGASAAGQGMRVGALSFVDNAVDTTTGTVMLKGTFRNEDASLWPGAFVNVTMQLTTDTALVVPGSALVSGQQGDYVFVVKADGTADQRPVQLDRMQGGLAVLRGGVNAGDRVVTDGQMRLRPGAKVQIKGQGAPAPGKG